MIYTMNAVESLQMSLRKVTKNRGSFPSEEAAFKLLYLALRNAGKRWRSVQGRREAMRQFEMPHPCSRRPPTVPWKDPLASTREPTRNAPSTSTPCPSVHPATSPAKRQSNPLPLRSPHQDRVSSDQPISHRIRPIRSQYLPAQSRWQPTSRPSSPISMTPPNECECPSANLAGPHKHSPLGQKPAQSKPVPPANAPSALSHR